jgi:hypothetical protein
MEAIAFYGSARPQDILAVWQDVENTGGERLADMINTARGAAPDFLYATGRWPDMLTGLAVDLARASLAACPRCAAAPVQHGCLGDGTCVCQFGWQGADCSVECKGGHVSPCTRNGLCIVDGSCLCDSGWTGLDCSIECAGGWDAPCSLQGACQMDGSCKCNYGYRGNDCAHMCPGREAMAVTGSRDWECSGRGVCEIYPYQQNNSATCVCQMGYAGLDCRLACPGFIEAAGICFEKGFCLADLNHIRLDGGLAYAKPNGWPSASAFPRPLGSCVCISGYRGDACHLRCAGNVPPLNTTSCSGHGECREDATCDCQAAVAEGADSGWRGASCQIECRGGASNICSGHGKCGADGSCVCADGWRLAACERECEGGAAAPCNGNGLCTANGSCLCDTAYRLRDCAKMCPGGPTVTNVCSRHGTCDATGVCICQDGWTGEDCGEIEAWVIACLCLMSVLVCCTGGCLARYQVPSFLDSCCTFTLVLPSTNRVKADM